MSAIGCDYSFELPTYDLSQDLVVKKIRTGVLLNELDYDTIVKDACEFTNINGKFTDNDPREEYLKLKYSSTFSLSRLNQAWSRCYANSQ